VPLRSQEIHESCGDDPMIIAPGNTNASVSLLKRVSISAASSSPIQVKRQLLQKHHGQPYIG
jgi:hypothetical protein